VKTRAKCGALDVASLPEGQKRECQAVDAGIFGLDEFGIPTQEGMVKFNDSKDAYVSKTYEEKLKAAEMQGATHGDKYFESDAPGADLLAKNKEMSSQCKTTPGTSECSALADFNSEKEAGFPKMTANLDKRQVVSMYNRPNKDDILGSPRGKQWLESDIGKKYQTYAATQDGQLGWYGRGMKWVGGLGVVQTLKSYNPMEYIKKPFTYVANTSAGKWIGNTRVVQYFIDHPLYAKIAGGVLGVGAVLFLFRKKIFGRRLDAKALDHIAYLDSMKQDILRLKMRSEDARRAIAIVDKMKAEIRSGKMTEQTAERFNGIARAIVIQKQRQSGGGAQKRAAMLRESEAARAKVAEQKKTQDEEQKKKQEEEDSHSWSLYLGLFLIALGGCACAGYVWWTWGQNKSDEELKWDIENPQPRSQGGQAPLPFAQKPRKVVQQGSQQPRPLATMKRIKMAYGPHVSARLPSGSPRHSPSEMISAIKDARESVTTSPRGPSVLEC